MLSDDELRALADRVRYAATFLMRPGTPSIYWNACNRAADYLRACADAQRNWVTIDTAIREYLYDYEMFGEDDAGTDCCYTPTERECDLIYDAINGLLADEHFMRLIAPHPAPAAPQAEPKRELWSGYEAGHRAGYALALTERRTDDCTFETDAPDEHTHIEEVRALLRGDTGLKEQAKPPRQAGQEISLGALMREQRQSRIVAGAFPDGNPAAKAMIAQTPQAEPKRTGEAE